MIVSVTYNLSEVPESLIVKGEEIDQSTMMIRIDGMITRALESAGLEWYASGMDKIDHVHDNAFDCDPERILNAPTEWEINMALAQTEDDEVEIGRELQLR